MNKIEMLANKFIEMLKAEMTAEQFAEMKSLNEKESNEGICHSHDFVDANEIMIISFEKCFNSEIDFDDDDNINLINDAWSLMKKIA